MLANILKGCGGLSKATDVKELVGHFQFEGDFVYGEPFGCGHINDTFAVYYK